MKKKGLVIALCIIAVIAVAIAIMLLIVPNAAVGTWARVTGYLSHYDCEAINVFILEEDRTFTQYLIHADTMETLKTTHGTWSVSGFEVNCRRPGQDGSTPFTYNPITNTMNNGGGLIPMSGDNIFRKIETVE